MRPRSVKPAVISALSPNERKARRLVPGRARRVIPHLSPTTIQALGGDGRALNAYPPKATAGPVTGEIDPGRFWLRRIRLVLAVIGLYDPAAPGSDLDARVPVLPEWKPGGPVRVIVRPGLYLLLQRLHLRIGDMGRILDLAEALVGSRVPFRHSCPHPQSITN